MRLLEKWINYVRIVGPSSLKKKHQKLPELHHSPEPILTLVSGGTSQLKHFLANIRKYNYMPTFKVQGQITTTTTKLRSQISSNLFHRKHQ